ncbi:adenosine deaminase [Nonomuraea sp. NPDC000554]|uniref:adenosine deaminase n=1 Tax=Nonomuraea sp. NPDC000554 TaxID=3154259 RepID=UPI00331FA39D
MSARIELHCHLDGSVRVPTIAQLAEEQGVSLPGPVRDLAVAPARPLSLPAYISRIDVALSVMQTAGALRRTARELVEDWARDGVVYGEARFAPQLHQRRGLTLPQILDAVSEGLAEGAAATGVQTGLILCCLRPDPVTTSIRVAELAAANAHRVAGLDLAGDEAIPAAPHAAAFRLAHEAGLPVTVHAGETQGPDSVRQALDELGARRIGHGVRAVHDDVLVGRLAREAVTLETCPTSNLQTGAVPSLAAHPARRLMARGVPVTVSTDARTVSGTTLGDEFEVLRRELGWTAADDRSAQLSAAAAAFLPAERRERLLRRLGPQSFS